MHACVGFGCEGVRAMLEEEVELGFGVREGLMTVFLFRSERNPFCSVYRNRRRK